MIADQDLNELFERARTIAVVGMSDRPERASYAVASYLQRHGYRIIPVNPNLHGPVLGEQPYASLHDIPFAIDIVNVFRRAEYLPGVIADAIACEAHAIWGQVGVEDIAAESAAREAGLFVMTNRCIAVEHRRITRYAEVAAYR